MENLKGRMRLIIMRNEDQAKLAEDVREACIAAARDGFKEAAMCGLCSEGAMEAAISAMQSLNVKKIVKQKK